MRAHSVILLTLLLGFSYCQVLEGLLPLDKISFDKLTSKFEYSLIKFDVGYPTGEKHKTFGKLSSEVSSVENVFIGEVRIKDYGDKGNLDLAERFSVDTDKTKLPETVLYQNKDGVLEEVVRYGGDYTIENLRSFITGKTGAYIQCDGCIQKFDTLAERFASAGSKEDREKILFAAESWANGQEDGDSDVYVKIMKTALDTGKEGLEKEIVRVERMMDNKSSDKVREKLTKKRNVLNSFRVKTEL